VAVAREAELAAEAEAVEAVGQVQQQRRHRQFADCPMANPI
jgi:hypothetical protein